MKRNKHYKFLINHITKQVRDTKASQAGLYMLLILNLFFGGCFMTTSTSKLEKEVKALEHQVQVVKQKSNENNMMLALYIINALPDKQGEELFDLLNHMNDMDRVELENNIDDYILKKRKSRL